VSTWLVRFGYDGRGFGGWARQPGRRTVEGTILGALPRIGVAPASASAAVAVASRTDRGVSARANALTMASSLPGPAVLRALNGVAPDIFFTAIRGVPDGFSARAAVGRTYRYFERAEGHRLARWKAGAARFRGDVDVRSLGRDIPAHHPLRRTIERVDVRRVGSLWICIEVRAPSFVWGMVRKIIGALRQVDAGRLSLPRLEAALRGEVRLTLPLAEAEGLVLWEVDYGVPWSREWTGPNRAQSRYLMQLVHSAQLQERIADELPGGLRGA